MPERAFGRKIQKVGFDDVRLREDLAYGLDDAARYPLFTPALIDLMRRVLPPERHERVAYGVIATARKP